MRGKQVKRVNELIADEEVCSASELNLEVKDRKFNTRRRKIALWTSLNTIERSKRSAKLREV